MVSKRGLLVVFVMGLSIGTWVTATWAEGQAKPMSNDVLRADLESAEGLEVIVSVVEIPAETALPKHYHPGEEFGYVVEGSVILWQQGKADVELKAGQAAKVPLEQIHTAKTGSEATKLVVFRVHEKGEPERVPVG